MNTKIREYGNEAISVVLVEKQRLADRPPGIMEVGGMTAMESMSRRKSGSGLGL
jgi:hypothetical protein